MLTRSPRLRAQAVRHVLVATVLGVAALLSGTASRSEAQTACPCTIFPSTAVPAVVNHTDTQSVELGVKFQSDVNGSITGIRYYKGSLQTGTRTANLWTTTGTLLATATFTNETTSGWQQVNFPTPVAITANTVYVASYFTPGGRYSINTNYFTTGVNTPPLHALANGVSANGVYRYGATSGFPTNTFQSSNYWVDVVFTTSGGAPPSDTTPPSVTSVSPANAAATVAVGANTTATFNENMLASSITTATFELRNQSNTLVPAAVSYNATTRVATLNPTANMAAGTSYTATVRGGVAGVKDLAGNPLGADRVWFFKTSGTDTTQPTVSAFAPANGATDVGTTPTVVVTFSEAMTASSINGTTVRVTRPDGTQVPATIAYVAANKQATVTFSAALAAGTTYTIRVLGGTSGVRDLANLTMLADAVASFTTTGTPADTTPPTVTAFTPVAGATGVSTTTTVTATFSEAMTASTITSSTFVLRTATNADVPATVAYNATTRVAALTPSSPLVGAATYTAIIFAGASGVKDLAGNAMISNVTWSFTTGDTTAPTVITFSPPANATDVNRATTVTATFSKAMNPSTITTTTMTLRAPGGALVAATVAYNGTTNVATLTPSATLAAGTVYTASVLGGAGGVTDTTGNPMASTVTWSFTTSTTSCTTNPVVCENTNPGSPSSEWDISGIGDPTIQGFTTDISVNKGGTIGFKIDTPATAYRLDIYRMGYYGGNGARLIATVRPSASLPQSQPACLNDSTTGLIDCGNWSQSASWTVPTTAVSGIYFAKAIREDRASDGSHIVFVVRDDASTADILFQTSDTTWQAYNEYGGNSLYTGSPAGRAFKVSYNRPFTTRGTSPQDFVFHGEYPMVRWLEANGYNVTYATDVDTDRRGVAALTQRKIFASVGHDEYWSGAQRANVEAARNAGIHLAFFSGNAVFWKTRWENSIDGSGTPYRTLVTYKETHANAKIDPLPNVWTGTWRDPRFSPPADGGRPENALMGTIFTVNNSGASFPLQVPQANGRLRFWRNTPVANLAAGATATLGTNIIGYEWDEDLDNGSRPPGLFQLSSSTINNVQVLTDFGSTYAPGTATHALTLYRHASGALVFGGGTVQWAWGLDDNHDGSPSTPNTSLQQATVNLLADMGVQPATLRPGLVAASASTDTARPTSTIASPVSGATVQPGQAVTISGTAADTGGGIVAAVEVSTDGGTSWRRATGTTSWTFIWTPETSGTATLRSRAVDDSANLETPSAGNTVTVGSGGGSGTCPCSIWSGSAVPTIVSDSDTAAVELGVKFRADVDGVISGIRFYKGAGNTGTHVGNLWTQTGQLLATATFTNETASGWQQVNFSPPVPIVANTIYIASYHAPVGRYAADAGFFATAGVDNGQLHALASPVSPNGVYAYGPGGFPANTYNATNYWVDVLFTPGAAPPDTTSPTVTAFSPGDGATGVSTGTTVTATFSEGMNASTINSTTFVLRNPSNTAITASVTYNATTRVATLTPASALAVSTTYTATILGGTTDPRVKDVAGNALASNHTWSFTTAATSAPPSGCPCTIWTASTTPAVVSDPDTAAVELGVKFRSDIDGFVTGVRFYKGPNNLGTHVGKLWSLTGELLASAPFTNETASGWQQVNFPTAVAITANTIYIASYHAPVGAYSTTEGYFSGAATSRPPLHALSTAESPNGVFAYGSGGFPAQSVNATNYWVDVVFDATAAPDTTAPRVVIVTPPSGASGISPATDVKVTFSEAMSDTTINTSTFELRRSDNTVVAVTLSYDASTRTASVRPGSPLSASSVYTLTVRGGGTDPRVKDIAGNALATNFTSSFSTATSTVPPALGQGPGGPILVVTSPQNRFSTYYSEILSTEGLNLFAVADLSTVSATTLSGFDVVILGEMPLTAAQVTMFTNWVNAGGNLIAMRPDKQLSVLLGLADAGAVLADAYLRIDTAAAPGTGLVSDTIQFHGTADRYTLSGAAAVATLFSTATAPTSNPAVSLRTVGAGHAAAFTYDLAKSVIYTRQGNPAWAGQERDGQAPIRSDDLFFGVGTQPNWVDFSKIAIPQADEQQRLLANLILVMNSARKPLPRFWYLPRGLKATVVMTGDDHGNGGTVSRFNQFLGASPVSCIVENWECPRYTSYVYPSTPPLSNSLAGFFESRGFEIALHVNTGCADYTLSSLATFYTDQLAEFRAVYPSVPAPTTNRTHCIVWSDWATQAKVAATNSIGLDTNYYYWPGSWIADRPGMFTGSGMPMRFADVDGTLIDVYQATTQMTDESNQTYPLHIDALLNNALGAQGYYGVFTANMHTDADDSPGADAILASAVSRGVPIVTARQMLEWVEGRNNSAFQGITWNGTNLGFSIAIGQGANGLQAMLPMQSGGRTLTSLTLNGVPVPFTSQLIKGVQWATFPATPGTYNATYATP